MKNDVTTLLQKEMDRKGFIKHVAIGFAAIAGLTAVAKTLSTMAGNNKTQSLGYGSSSYGGSSPSSSNQKPTA